MAKQNKKKTDPKNMTHWQSFRDDMLPWANSNIFSKIDKPIDYDTLKSYLAECTGFGDFLHTHAGRMIYSGLIPGYAPMANELYSVSLWDACGRIILRPSEGLLRLLMETDASIPICDVHPPFPSVFIEIPPGLLRIEDASTGSLVNASGMYVSWGDIGSVGEHSKHIELTGGKLLNDCNKQARVLAIGPGDPRSNIPLHNWALRYMSLCWGEPCTHSVDHLVETHLTKLDEENDQAEKVKNLFSSGTVWKHLPDDEFMLRIAANLFLYMSCPDADIIKNHSELHDRLLDFRKRKVSSERRKRVKRQIDQGMVPSVTINVGSSIVIKPGQVFESTDIPSEGGRKSPRPHWRKGHFKTVRFGEGRKQSKIKWIMPVLVRKDAGGDVEIKSYEVRT